MDPLTRRSFMRAGAAAAAIGVSGMSRSLAGGAQGRQRKFYMNLPTNLVQIKADPFEAIKLAKQWGFDAVSPLFWAIAKYSESEQDRLAAEMKAAGLRWGGSVVWPFFHPDDAKFRESSEKTRETLKALQRVGVNRCFTWTMPGSNNLTYLQNFRLHVNRTRAMGELVGEFGMRLGIEYVAPKVYLLKSKFAFIRTLAEMKELVDEIKLPNVGIALDAWHWFHAEDTAEDLLKLTNRDVVVVDVCDAPAGVPRGLMPDSPRKLPCTTGVIDLKPFMEALVQVGYDGPVGTEPSDESLKGKSNEENLKAVSTAMKKAFALIP